MNTEFPTTVGRIQKAHGLKGHLSVLLNPGISFPQIPRNPTHLWVELGGRMLPYVCLELKPRIPGGLLVLLEGITTPDAAQALSGCLLAVQNLKAPAVANRLPAWPFTESELIGALLVDPDLGPLGPIVAWHKRPPQDFLEFTVQGKSVFLPLVPEWILSWQAANSAEIQAASTASLCCRLPDGLLECYLDTENGAYGSED
jgi:ribosomal 30S subunit maturation factor RimM